MNSAIRTWISKDMAGDGRELEAEEIRADLDTVALCRSDGSG